MSDSTSLKIPYLHWGDYKSNDENKPDVILLKIVDVEPVDGTYSTNIKAEVESKENNGLFFIPLHSYTSKNTTLLNEFSKLFNQGKIKNGSSLKVNTWLGVSTRDATKPMRRWKISSTSS